MVNGGRHLSRRSLRWGFAAEPINHQLGGLVVTVGQLFGSRKRLQTASHIDQQLAIIAALFVAVLPGLVPIGDFDADEDTHDDYEEVECDREPVLSLRMFGHASGNHGSPLPFDRALAEESLS